MVMSTVVNMKYISKFIDITFGTNSGIIFLIPTICTDIQESNKNLCVAFLGWQVTISLT